MSAATAALTAWGLTGELTAEPVAMGNINPTWRIVQNGSAVAFLQQLNTDIFAAVVHEDIEAVTAHLAAKGLNTPRLLRTKRGELWHTAPDGAVFRLQSPVGNRSIERIDDPGDARSAAALVARFHAAVSDLSWDFRSVRAGAHDTPKHMAGLSHALAAHTDHRLYDQVAPVGAAVLAAWEQWDGPTDLPERIIHGDLKISNIRFQDAEASALIDLDTFQLGNLDTELGDALRSWCNPASEDASTAALDLGIFEAAMVGYAQGSVALPPSADEWASIVPGLQRISLELAARFARDALEERYFGWSERFGTAGQHHLVRARGQLSLASQAMKRRSEAEAVLAAARRRV